jgi:hypothetical protein
MLRKTPMWGNPMRERDILLFDFRKIYISSKITISSKRNPLIAHYKQSQKLCLVIRAKSVLLYDPPIKLYLEIHAHNQLYRLLCTTQQQQVKPSIHPRKSCQNFLDFLHPLSLDVQTVRINVWIHTV